MGRYIKPISPGTVFGKVVVQRRVDVHAKQGALYAVRCAT
jgi:hypothetical protein